MATTNAQTFTIGGVTHQVEDTTARAGVASLQTALASLQSALDTLIGTDDITDEIDTYNEIKEFLDGFDVNDPNLSEQLTTLFTNVNDLVAAMPNKASTTQVNNLQTAVTNLQTALAGKYTKPETGIPETHLAQAVRDLLALAGTAVQPSTLNGYVTTSTLEGYYTKSEVNGLIPDISGKADKSEMAVTDNNNGTVTITLKTGTSATVLTQHQSLAGYALSSSLATVATSGSYNDLSNKPTIPTKVSDLTNDSGFITDTDTPLVVVSTTGGVTQALDSGKWYHFGTIDSLTLTLNAVASGCVGTYFGRFTASSSWTDIAVPNGVTAATSNDTIEGGKTYEFSIVDSIIKINEV